MLEWEHTNLLPSLSLVRIDRIRCIISQEQAAQPQAAIPSVKETRVKRETGTLNTWRIALAVLLLVPAIALAGGGDVLFENDYQVEPLGPSAWSTVGNGLHPQLPFGALADVVDNGGNRSLEVTDNNSLFLGSIKVNMLNDEEVTSGIVCITYTVTFDTLNNYTFSVYKLNVADITAQHSQIKFLVDGSMSFFDANNLTPSFYSTTYQAGVPIKIEYVFDQDAGTYDCWINSVQHIFGEDHGATGGGIGTLWFQCGPDFNIGDKFRLDDFLIEKGNAVQTGVAQGADTESIRPLAMMAMPWPNPVDTAANLSFTLPQTASATVNVFDLAGRKVTTLLDETRGAGAHTLQWNRRDTAGRRVNAGVYFVRLETLGTQVSRKVIVVE